ncbi:hypothetical protein SH467x_003528 [Pirellulaceae bacterium SH467]
MTNHQPWLVSVDHQVDVASVARALSQRGFQVKEVLAEISCITGVASEKDIPSLRRTTGVLDISPDFPIEISPREEDL